MFAGVETEEDETEEDVDAAEEGCVGKGVEAVEGVGVETESVERGVEIEAVSASLASEAGVLASGSNLGVAELGIGVPPSNLKPRPL